MKLIIINKVKETVKHLLPIYLFTCLLLDGVDHALG